MKKVSILIPTYNDEKYIEETLDSIRLQDYHNYEILICDDGSIDNTKKIIENYQKKYKINLKYFYEDNADQLNAIITLIPYITGDYVYILHSDDILYNDRILTKMVKYMENSNADSIIGDLVIIDKNSKDVNTINVSNYKNKKSTIALQLLWLGRNLYVDMAFHKKEVFLNNVYNNYLLWNGPFWLNLDTNSLLNVEKVNFSFFKYRVFEDNYINEKGANYNVVNGEIRVVTRLLQYYYIPFYKFQYIMYRIFNKLKLSYTPIYLNREIKNKYKIIKFVLEKRFSIKEIKENVFLDSLLNFYKNKTSRKIKIDLNNIKLYYGKDMRIFNKKINNKTLEEFYYKMFEEMKLGFNEIEVKSKEEKDKALILTKFLCIYPYVKITIKR